MVNCFIEIRKSALKRRLKELNIRWKYQDKICNGVKAIIEDSLEDLIQQAIEERTKMEGQQSLKKYN